MPDLAPTARVLLLAALFSGAGTSLSDEIGPDLLGSSTVDTAMTAATAPSTTLAEKRRDGGGSAGSLRGSAEVLLRPGRQRSLMGRSWRAQLDRLLGWIGDPPEGELGLSRAPPPR